MNVDDMILISIDDHVVEPPDMFKGRMPAKYADAAPRIVADEDGVESWVFEGAPVSTTLGLNAVVTWPNEEWGFDPASMAEMRPGSYDVHERIRDMNRNGVFQSVCFPTFVGFSGKLFMDTKDKDLALATVQAYNDWHIEGWCGAYPGRFIPNAIPAIWDAELLAGEVHRVARKGCRAITMPELPHLLGLPSYHTDWWDPFWNAVSDEDFTVNLHIGQGFAAITTAPEAPIETLLVLSTQVSVIAAQDLLWGPVFRKYPNVKVAWSEGGIGWIPFFLDRCDRTYINQTWAGQDFGGKLPSEVFRDHSLACYVTDPSSLYNRERIGMDIIAWEADYPHSDCLWPDAPEQVMAELTAAGCNDQEIEKITWQNTARFMRFDPFAVIPKERATVGALRALDPNVDTAVHSRAEWKRMYAEKQVASV